MLAHCVLAQQVGAFDGVYAPTSHVDFYAFKRHILYTLANQDNPSFPVELGKVSASIARNEITHYQEKIEQQFI
jgi:hypothetical protein